MYDYLAIVVMIALNVIVWSSGFYWGRLSAFRSIERYLGGRRIEKI